MHYILVLLACVLVTAGFDATAHAQSVYECGAPEAPGLETDPGFEYCDIHSRRFAYKKSRDEFRAQIEARRENYQAPHSTAMEMYKQDLEGLYGQDGYNR